VPRKSTYIHQVMTIFFGVEGERFAARRSELRRKSGEAKSYCPFS